MTAKAQFIQAQRLLYPIEPIASFTSRLNTPSLVNNPTERGTVPKPLSILEIASDLVANDRRLLQNQGSYNSLITNINKGDLLSIQADIQNLATTPQLSTEGVTVLNEALAASAETIPDPNWQAQLMLSPAQVAGFGTILTSEVVEALQEV